MKEIHRVHAGAIGAEHDDAQIGTPHRLVRTCYDEKGAHRSLRATSPVATRIRPSLQSGHQHIFKAALRCLRVPDRSHDAVEYFRPRQRIPLNENVRSSAISVVIGSTVPRVLNDLSPKCCQRVLPNRKLLVERRIADHSPYRIRVSALAEELHRPLSRQVTTYCLRDEHPVAGQQTHDAVHVARARSPGYADSLCPGIEYDDRPRRRRGAWKGPCDQKGEHAAAKNGQHLVVGRKTACRRAPREHRSEVAHRRVPRTRSSSATASLTNQSGVA